MAEHPPRHDENDGESEYKKEQYGHFILIVNAQWKGEEAEGGITMAANAASVKFCASTQKNPIDHAMLIRVVNPTGPTIRAASQGRRVCCPAAVVP